MSHSAPTDRNAPAAAGEFSGTERFEVIRPLGEGGYGAVYEAHDLERQERVALKVLQRGGPDQLMRFKTEFRSLQDLEHPNLIRLGELFEEEGNWFFTMELVPGTDFLSYVRSVDRASDSKQELLPFDEARLRRALSQLADGLAFLHESGRVHRDIKPSNLQVTEDGRVVLLDFGLVMHTEGRASTEAHAVGTVAYMAPEQAASQRVGPAADWYSVGAILYEALTGRLPFSGSIYEVLVTKQTTRPKPPSALIAAVPADLNDLCLKLLDPSPDARPDQAATRKQLRAYQPANNQTEVARQASLTRTRGVPFVGRQHELKTLAEAFTGVQRHGRLGMVHIHGPSGVGKSALVKESTEVLSAEDPRVVVLRGRCYERETVPFKALDGVVDALTRFLRGLRESECAVLLPRRAAVLPFVFPVLGRVKAIAAVPAERYSGMDRATLRTHALSALRELFERFADNYRVVLVIEDLQWADADSMALLQQLVRPPDPPPALFITTGRPLESCPQWVTETLHQTMQLAPWSASLPLDGLPPVEAEQLAAALIASGEQRGMLDSRRLAREADGHPLFIEALVQYGETAGELASDSPGLEDALAAHIDSLQQPTREVLEVVAVAAAPVAQSLLADVLGCTPGQLTPRLGALRLAKLVRTTRSKQQDSVESFHDRTRLAVLARMDGEKQVALHRSLANSMERSGSPDEEAIAQHWIEANEPARAAKHAVLAAERANEALAFEKAARLYETAVEYAEQDDPELMEKWGDSLTNAGKGAEAAEVFRRARQSAPEQRHGVLLRKAAQALLGSGEVDAGLEVAGELLASIGVKLPRTPARALMSLLYHRARLRMRGYRFAERDVSEVAEDRLQQVDTLWAVAALGMVDHIRGADLQTQHLLWALDTGEPYRVSRALSMEFWMHVPKGADPYTPSPAAELAKTLADQTKHPHALALYEGASAARAYALGLLPQTLQHADTAETILRERCTAVAWELTNARMFASFALMFMCRNRELETRLESALQEARERGDRYAIANLTIASGYVPIIARGHYEHALSAVNDAMDCWSQQGFFVQQFMANIARCQIHLAAGQPRQALQAMEADWDALERSKLLHATPIRMISYWARGRALTACAAEGGDDHARLLKRARADLRLLSKEPVAIAAPLAAVALPAVKLVEGAPERQVAEELRSAAQLAEQRHLILAALVARRVAAELSQVPGDSDVSQAVNERMRQAGIAEPDAMLRIYWPPAVAAAASRAKL